MPLVDTRAGILYPHKPEDNPNHDPNYLVDDLQQLQQHIAALVAKAFDKHTLEHLDTSGQEDLTTFDDDSLVLLGYPVGDRPPTKLDTRWRGPYKVLKHDGPRYTLLNLVRGSTRDVHVSRLKAYLHDPAMGVTPLEVACRDDEAYVVAAIRGHEGSIKSRTTLRFLVHWEGFSDTEDTWEPYSELRHNAHLHTYLTEHRMTTLIPKAHKK